MQLHDLKRKNERKKTRVGRGGRRGKTSGSGHKGQKARGNPRPAIRDVIKKLPKNRGYSFNTIQTKPVVINLNLIDRKFSDGDVVSPMTLISKNILNLKKGSVVGVKILSMGEISKKITVEGCNISEKAAEKIKKAGGEIKKIKKQEIKNQKMTHLRRQGKPEKSKRKR